GGAAGFGFDTDRTHGGADGEHLLFGEACDLAGAGDAEAEVHDVGLGGGQVVAQVDDGGSEPPDLGLGGAHDVRELGELGGRLLGCQVGGDTDLGDDPGEVEDGFAADTELAGELGDAGELFDGDRDFGGHVP